MTPVALHVLIFGTASAGGLMLLLWLIHLLLCTASEVGSGWARGLALLGVLYTVLGDGWVMRSVFFLLRMKGIPRSEDYRQYQQTTSAFVPWFPRI